MMPDDVAAKPPSPFEAALDRARREPGYVAYSALANAKEAAPKDRFPPYRLAVLRNFTIEPVLPAIEAQVLLCGRRPETYVADFDASAAEVHDPDAGLYRHNPDAIIIANWLETLSPQLATAFPELTAQDVATEIDRLCQDTLMLLTAIRRQSNAPILINNFPLPAAPAMGILDAQDTCYQAHTLIRLNQALIAAAKQIADVYWVDYFSLFAAHGYRHAVNDRHWNAARAPLSAEILTPLGDHYGALLRVLFGQVRKCLVLDCDGTLWGGIVGEDGLDGIKVSAAYQAFQREALNLRRRGVMLAICSKNNEPDVLEVLREHPDMLLREEHFVATQINWDDKATNLRRIAEELNIGIDALVFADDNAFECDFIRQAVPEVAVLHVSGDPSGFRTLLTDRAFFDTPTLSAEDAKRSEMMAAERTRKRMVSAAESLEDYLRSLEIVATIGVPGPREIGRVAQLTQKTNQFNLTTRRYTEGDIERFLAAPDMGVYYLKLRDKVSDIGLIGVAITKPREDDGGLEIDTFLMSCRALGRGAEDTLMARIAKDAAMNGYRELVGAYLPTKKNEQVADFYAKRGFAQFPEQGEGTSWRLDLGGQDIKIPDWIHLADGNDGGDEQ